METTATPRRRDADVRSRRRRYAPPDYAHRGHFWWVAQLIGWLFRPKPDILKAVDEAMAVLPKGEPFVGLHVRHGDKCRGERPDGPSVGDPSSFLNLDDTGRPEDHRIECGSFTEYMIHARYAASAKPRGQVAATPRLQRAYLVGGSLAPPRLRREYFADGSRHRRGCHVDIPWRAATPRPSAQRYFRFCDRGFADEPCFFPLSWRFFSSAFLFIFASARRSSCFRSSSLYLRW